MKTNKSIAKRIKVTSTGKLMARKAGFNHFNAKQTRTKQLNGRKGVEFEMTNKLKSRLLPYS
jgi:ribosomal protein L35